MRYRKPLFHWAFSCRFNRWLSGMLGILLLFWLLLGLWILVFPAEETLQSPLTDGRDINTVVADESITPPAMGRVATETNAARYIALPWVVGMKDTPAVFLPSGEQDEEQEQLSADAVVKDADNITLPDNESQNSVVVAGEVVVDQREVQQEKNNAASDTTAVTVKMPETALENTQDTRNTQDAETTVAVIEETDVAPAVITEDTQTKTSLRTHEVVIQQGDSMAAVFSRLGLSPATLHAIVSQRAAASLKRLYPGERLLFIMDETTGTLQEMHYRLAMDEMLLVKRTPANDFRVEKQTISLQVRQRLVEASIQDSLFLTGRNIGLTDKMIMQLANIFSWDIDFFLDVRRGDRFTILYEELYEGGKKVANGNILAASFTNVGKTLTAARYTDLSGEVNFYAANGAGMRRAFIRTPVDFTRISSKFNLRRLHPILNKVRAHRGVDYAAPTGTKVIATGNGIIEFIGNKGGYGRTIIIKHAGKFHTLYGHLSRYAKKLRKGVRVKQGQTIGYVGQTGLATGPHLHYEFRVNGVHKDPLTVKLPNTISIETAEMARFKEQTAELFTTLAQGVQQDEPLRLVEYEVEETSSKY